MSVMEITTNIGCRNACTYCPQEMLVKAYAKRSNIRLMSFALFKECVDKIPLDTKIIFSGFGEPWLNTECTTMLLYAHQKGHRIDAYTTLAGMSASDVDLLEQVPFGSFVVHLPAEEGYEKIDLDENYLKTLERLLKSTIKVLYHVRLGTLHHKLRPLLKSGDVECWSTNTRSGNIEVESRPMPAKKAGSYWLRAGFALECPAA